jgi:hypothetical protein
VSTCAAISNLLNDHFLRFHAKSPDAHSVCCIAGRHGLIAPGQRRHPEEAAAKALLAGPKFQKAKASLAGDYDQIVKDIITLTEIAAPPFKEQARGEAYLAMLKAEGLEDVEMDGKGNVMGLRRGTGHRPAPADRHHRPSGHRLPRRHQCEGAPRGRHALCAGHW